MVLLWEIRVLCWEGPLCWLQGHGGGSSGARFFLLEKEGCDASFSSSTQESGLPSFGNLWAESPLGMRHAFCRIGPSQVKSPSSLPLWPLICPGSGELPIRTPNSCLFYFPFLVGRPLRLELSHPRPALIRLSLFFSWPGALLFWHLQFWTGKVWIWGAGSCTLQKGHEVRGQSQAISVGILILPRISQTRILRSMVIMKETCCLSLILDLILNTLSLSLEVTFVSDIRCLKQCQAGTNLSLLQGLVRACWQSVDFSWQDNTKKVVASFLLPLSGPLTSTPISIFSLLCQICETQRWASHNLCPPETHHLPACCFSCWFSW